MPLQYNSIALLYTILMLCYSITYIAYIYIYIYIYIYTLQD